MYKVFFNDRIIKIVSENKILSENQAIQLVEGDLSSKLKTIINQFLKSHDNELILVAFDEKKVWKEFKRNFKIIKAAGGIVKKGEEFLFIYRMGKWDLPKGKIDKGESTKSAALREVEEECGISNLKISKKLPKTWHIYKSDFKDSKGKWILKKTSWFEMDYLGEGPLVPQIEEDISEAVWAEKSEADSLIENSYASIRELWSTYA